LRELPEEWADCNPFNAGRGIFLRVASGMLKSGHDTPSRGRWEKVVDCRSVLVYKLILIDNNTTLNAR
jgi:hypothetical protein